MKNCNALKKDLHSKHKGLHLVVSTSSERWQSSYTCSPKIPPTKLKKIWKTSKKRLKARKLIQIGNKVMTKLWEDKQEKHLKRDSKKLTS